MRKLLLISAFVLISTSLFPAAFLNDPMLPQLFSIHVASRYGEKHGRSNTLIISLKPYFNIENVRVRIEFEKNSMFNTFRDPRSVEIGRLEKGEEREIPFRYVIDAGYRQKEFDDFFNRIKILIVCDYPIKEVYGYLNQIHPDDTEDTWFELKKNLLRCRDTDYKFRKDYAVILPSFESFRTDYTPLYYRLHHPLPGELPYSFLIYMPGVYDLKHTKLISEWNETINILASATEKINPYIINNSVELSKKYGNYIDGLRIEFYLCLFRQDYTRAKKTSYYLLRELKALHGESFWDPERVGIVINHAVCDFLSGNKKRAIRDLENIRVIVEQKRLRHILKYVLYNLAIFNYFQGNTPYTRTLLERCIRLDSDFNLPKKIISRIRE